MKSTRKHPIPALGNAMQIVEAGIEKIVGEIDRERAAAQGKPARPRGARTKGAARRAA
ncbi:MAG TPA: hypothetical protein GYA10_13385 [Alphaproteobacteria bacterium]|nr:hypothetical protein [Alphaproteobacteria bacterium]